MMKRLFLLLFANLIYSAYSYSTPVSLEEAIQVARTFLETPKQETRSVGQETLTLVYTGGTDCKVTRSATNLVESVTEVPTFYVFNRGEGQGFVIVSGETGLSPIIGYSDEGHFATQSEVLPDHIAHWMDAYNKYVEDVRDGIRPAEESVMVTTRATSAIEPLVTTRWSQDRPYNLQCPYLESGKQTVTGCTATAIAQIMKYHNWPDCGTGSNTHAGISVNYANSKYDWTNMLDRYNGSYTTAQANAVAKLMVDIGVAVWMSYGESSGAQNTDIYGALYRHFKYSKKMKFVMRNSYSTQEWIDILRNELESKRPIYYGGYTEDGTLGHAFVCDGIDAYNFLHINWGWAGTCDGYFHLNFMNPETPGIGGGEGGYNTDQTAIIGIEPATEDESHIVKQAVLAIRSYYRTTTKKIGVNKRFTTNVSDIWSQGPGTFTFQAAAGLFKDGQFQKIVSDKKSITLQMWGWQTDISLGVTIDEEIPDGEYELRVVTSADDTTWEETGFLYHCYQRAIPIEVSEGMVLVNQPKHSGVSFSATPDDVTATSTRLPGKTYTADFILKNTSGRHFNGDIKYEVKSVPPPINTEFTTEEQHTDTVVIASGSDVYFVYSEGEKQLSFNYQPMDVGAYLIELYFKDPVSQQFLRFAEYPFEIVAPKEKYPRYVVFEQLVSTTYGQSPAGYVAFNEMAELHPTDFIGINVHGASSDPMQVSTYVNNLNLGTTVSSRVNRQPQSVALPNIDSYNEQYQYVKRAVPVAGINLTAQFPSSSPSILEATLSATFAYDIEGGDYRFSIVSVERNISKTTNNFKQINDFSGGTTVMGGYESLDNPVPAKLMNYDWTARGFFPNSDFNGAKGSLPEDIKAGETYTYSFRVTLSGFWNRSNAMLVGLLIDAQSGEICNATLLPYQEIAPLEGEAKPIGVDIDLEECVMNVGVSVLVEAHVIPLIAPNRLTWQSSNTSIATVNEDGVVTALAPGEVDIYAISADSILLADTLKLTVKQSDFSVPQEVRAGYLHYLIGQEQGLCPETLILSGELNGTDIRLLRSLSAEKGLLKHLDLSAARIVEGGTSYYEDYYTQNDIVGEKMFYGLCNLQTLNIPESTTSIENNALNLCSNLVRFYIPASVTTIGYAPFYGCLSLEEISVASENKKYRVLNNALTNMARSEIIAYPAGHKTDGFEAPSGARIIHPFAFSGASNLKAIVTVRTFNTIGYAAFEGCSNLERIELKSRTAEIADYAFSGCTALNSLVCEATTPPICSAYSFSSVDTENCFLYVPEESIEEYRIAEGWKDFYHMNDLALTVEQEQIVKTPVRISTENNVITIHCSMNGLPIKVYTLTGTLVAQGITTGQDVELQVDGKGLYIIKLADCRFKIIVK